MKKVRDIECKVEKHRLYNQISGLIYIHEFDIEIVETFKEELREEYKISNVELANFIKLRYPETKVFILTFEQEYLPEYICIFGESADT